MISEATVYKTALTALLLIAAVPAHAVDCGRLSEAAHTVAESRFGGVDYGTAMRAAETDRQRALVRDAYALPYPDSESAQRRTARWFADDVFEACTQAVTRSLTR